MNPSILNAEKTIDGVKYLGLLQDSSPTPIRRIGLWHLSVGAIIHPSLLYLNICDISSFNCPEEIIRYDKLIARRLINLILSDILYNDTS